MSAMTAPASAQEALGMLECAAGFLADMDAAGMPTEAVAELPGQLRHLEYLLLPLRVRCN